MDDVTDVVFRQLVAEICPPDVFMTEFTSTDGLQSRGREHTLERLRLPANTNQPTVAQIWGDNPERFYLSAQDIAHLGFTGIDLNLGCPEKGKVARGCCGGMIGNTTRVAEILAAIRAGAPNLALSVKTRIGLRTTITEDWAGFLLTQNLAALTIHGRTVREMSKVPARWEEIAKVVKLRDEINPNTIIIGNGDIESRAHGLKLAAETGVDGLMIGRGVFHDPFAFAQTPTEHTPEEMVKILLRHVELYEQWESSKQFQTLKRFFKIYIHTWPGAAELRAELMNTTTPSEVRAVLAVYAPPQLEAVL